MSSLDQESEGGIQNELPEELENEENELQNELDSQNEGNFFYENFVDIGDVIVFFSFIA